MASQYMDIVVEIGRLYRLLTKKLSESIQKNHKIPPSINYMELILLYEMKNLKDINPQKIAKEGQYMISH